MYLPHCLYTSIHANNHVVLLSRSKKFFSVLQKTNRLLLYIRVYDENWYVAHQLIYQMKIGVRSADSRKWTDRRSETVRREKKKLFLSSALRNSLSAMSPLRCSPALSQRKISRKTSRTRIAVNDFAGDLKFIEQVVHTDDKVIVTEGLGADYVPPSLPVELRRWFCVHCGLTGSPCRWTRS